MGKRVVALVPLPRRRGVTRGKLGLRPCRGAFRGGHRVSGRVICTLAPPWNCRVWALRAVPGVGQPCPGSEEVPAHQDPSRPGWQPGSCPRAQQFSEMESSRGTQVTREGLWVPGSGPSTPSWSWSPPARAGMRPGPALDLPEPQPQQSGAHGRRPSPHTFLGTLVMMGLGRVLKRSLVLMRAVTA